MTSVTVTIWHSVASDGQGGTPPRWTGSPATRWCASSPTRPCRAGAAPRRSPGTRSPVQRPPPRRRRPPGAVPASITQRRLHSLSVGNVVAVGEAGLAVGHAGWTLVRGGLNEVRTDEHGTHPLPPDAQRGTRQAPVTGRTRRCHARLT